MLSRMVSLCAAMKSSVMAKESYHLYTMRTPIPYSLSKACNGSLMPGRKRLHFPETKDIKEQIQIISVQFSF